LGFIGSTTVDQVSFGPTATNRKAKNQPATRRRPRVRFASSLFSASAAVSRRCSIRSTEAASGAPRPRATLLRSLPHRRLTGNELALAAATAAGVIVRAMPSAEATARHCRIDRLAARDAGDRPRTASRAVRAVRAGRAAAWRPERPAGRGGGATWRGGCGSATVGGAGAAAAA
jgi:hypothetical protein